MYKENIYSPYFGKDKYEKGYSYMIKSISYKLLLPKEKLNYIAVHLVSICLLLFISGICFMKFITITHANQLQENIANEVIRFHVVANSDTNIDQSIKMVIKEQLTKTLSPNLKEANTIHQARSIIESSLLTLEEVSNQILEEHGYSYTAKASLEKGYFPLKVYGDLSLPPGEYEAIRIELGKAEGQNWWCIMFPPLCFIDSTYTIVPDESKSQLKEVLSEEEYESLFTSKEIKVKVKFKLFELLFPSK